MIRNRGAGTVKLMARYGVVGGLLTVMSAVAGHASATVEEVLKIDSQIDVCVNDADQVNEKYVGRSDLALEIVRVAGAASLLSRVQGDLSRGNKAIGQLVAREPFPDAAANDPAVEKFKVLRDAFIVYLSGFGGSIDGFRVKARPGVETRDFTLLSFLGTNEREYKTALSDADVTALKLNERALVDIQCVDAGTRVAEDSWNRGSRGSFGQRIRIRNKASDLTIAGNQLKGANAAAVSLTRNVSERSSTAQIDGVLGVAFSDADKEVAYTYIPYLEYHRSTTTVAGEVSDKVETLAPGFTFNMLTGTRAFTWSLSVSPQYVFDTAQDTEFLKGTMEFLPSFKIFDDIRLGIGNELLGGDIVFRPSIKVIGDAGWTTQAGNSQVLGEDDQYYALGGAANATVVFPKADIFKRLAFKAGYRYLRLYSVPLESAGRWSLSADYYLDDDQHYSISAQYENGRHHQTFQDEEFWKVALGILF